MVQYSRNPWCNIRADFAITSCVPRRRVKTSGAVHLLLSRLRIPAITYSVIGAVQPPRARGLAMKRLGLLVLIGYTASAGVAHAATYYVAKSGNNGNTCAQAQSTSTAKLTIA